MSKFIDITGQRFTYWTVRERAPHKEGSHKAYQWYCDCDCGTQGIVTGYSLTSGHSKSCGCLQIEGVVKRNARHGYASRKRPVPREYWVWVKAKQRCNNPKDKNFHHYGGRGIKMCAEWADDFSAFLRDMGRRPAGLQLDRIDNDGNYQKSNCRWATRKEQARNMRTNQFVTINGDTLCVVDWTNRMGYSKNLISGRLHAGWSQEDAVLKPPRDWGRVRM